MSDEVSALRKQLQQLAGLHTSGALDDAAYQEGRARLERRLVDAVMSTPSTEAAGAGGSGRAPAKLLGALAGLVLVIAVAGYWLTGAPERIAELVPVGEAGSAPSGQAHALTFEQIEAMADKLAERLKAEPGNTEGWAMLARSYAVLGRNPEAVDAYKRAADLGGDDAGLLADYADALATQNNRSLSGEPAVLVERALKLDPDNLKALSLAGTAAFDRKDYAAAARHWERLVQLGPTGDPMVQQARSSAEEARALGKLPAGVAAAPLAGARSVSGSVTLAPALAKLAGPDDTVFVFARTEGGAPMPLAVLRKQVKDLPLTFLLDDSMAMSPAARLSSASRVVVSARVSKSGDAIPQAGDLSGQSAPVAVGASGLHVEIGTVVKK